MIKKIFIILLILLVLIKLKDIPPNEPFTIICNKEGSCENVPDNRLLFKSGTNKTKCSNAPYLSSDYVDNPYNFEGDVIDECEITTNSSMIFRFKQHDQSFRNHSGTIQVTITTVNTEPHGIVQVLTADKSQNWKECKGISQDCISCIENIPKGRRENKILCEGEELQFIKVLAAPWSPTSIFLDSVEVWKYD